MPGSELLPVRPHLFDDGIIAHHFRSLALWANGCKSPSVRDLHHGLLGIEPSGFVFSDDLFLGSGFVVGQ